MDDLLELKSSLRTASEPRMPDSPAQPFMLAEGAPWRADANPAALPAAPVPVLPGALLKEGGTGHGRAAAGLAPEDPGLVALLAARAAAEGQVSTGDHAGALDTLLQSLRDVDPARFELADAAYGNGQMVSYVLLHVMPEPAAYAYMANGFQPATYEMDKLVKALCTIAIGLAEADKTAQTREVAYLTSSENPIVRAMAMYFLSNPYFYDNPDFTGQYAEQLATDYPDLELTQTSMNLALYAKRERGDLPDLAEEISAKATKSLPFQPWSQSLRARIKESANNLAGKAPRSRAEAVAPLLRGITEAQDWHERHFALLLMKYELDGPLAADLRDAMRQLAHRKKNTPDVLQARALLATALGADCVQDRGNEALKDEALAAGEALLEGGVGETTPERVMWETWAYGVRDCAKSLVAAGHTEEAIQLFTGLSEKLPGSKIAAECDEARNELFHTKPLELQSSAEESPGIPANVSVGLMPARRYKEPKSELVRSLSSPRTRGSSALARFTSSRHWIPAFAGMTERQDLLASRPTDAE